MQVHQACQSTAPLPSCRSRQPLARLSVPQPGRPCCQAVGHPADAAAAQAHSLDMRALPVHYRVTDRVRVHLNVAGLMLAL